LAIFTAICRAIAGTAGRKMQPQAVVRGDARARRKRIAAHCSLQAPVRIERPQASQDNPLPRERAVK
jgi:hypothetical protein